MAKNLGTFQFAANFQVKAAEALDPRMVASSKADLINKANWPSDGDTIYVYNGLIVDCGSDGVYRLIDASKALNADYSGWERIDAGGINIDNIFTYKGNVENYESLPTNANTGDVYNVETEFTITTTSELGEESIVKTYLAGTNVAWNGNSWDPLAGSIDLSLYATKTEVSEVRTNAATNTANITKLSEDLGKTNEEVAKKVDAVEGSSLISSEKLALIDTNASDIEELKTNVGALSEEDTKLSTRIATLENLVGIEEDGTPGENASLETRVSANESAIDLLESDNTTNKTNIGNLQTTVSQHDTKIAEVVAANAQQTTDISNLSTKVSTLETGVSGLTTTVGTHTTDIADIKSSINGLAVKSVKSDDKVLQADASGVLSTTIALNYDTENKKIQLTGIEGTVVSEFDASDFVKDGMINSVSYDPATQDLTIKWNTDGGKTQDTVIDMSGLVDTYTAGSGLKVENNEFAVKLDTNSNNKLTVSDNGLLVDISADIAALESTMDSKIESAFSWEDVTE